MKPSHIASYGFIILVLTISAASAFAIDTDGDLVDDSIDNCLLDPNGPNEQSNQIDVDADGYGNRCDPDFKQDGIISGRDATTLLTIRLLQSID